MRVLKLLATAVASESLMQFEVVRSSMVGLGMAATEATRAETAAITNERMVMLFGGGWKVVRVG